MLGRGGKYFRDGNHRAHFGVVTLELQREWSGDSHWKTWGAAVTDWGNDKCQCPRREQAGHGGATPKKSMRRKCKRPGPEGPASIFSWKPSRVEAFRCDHCGAPQELQAPILWITRVARRGEGVLPELGKVLAEGIFEVIKSFWRSGYKENWTKFWQIEVRLGTASVND